MSSIEDIRQRWRQATPGPWYWRGSTRAFDVTLSSARALRPIVLWFKRWGMGDARPGFRDAQRDTLIVPPFIAPHDHRPWDIEGIDHPDARFIAASWADVRDLLGAIDGRDAEIARLRAALSGLLGGMDELCHYQHGTTWRGGNHTEAMYQEAVAVLLNGMGLRALGGDAPDGEAVPS